ncbi:hypothetical protein CN526_23040 [Bacillus wiedmannii]|uniref:hypothetical protein n=1 Tax=Bacillus wiedmannii TaxID=1890302 RepID=UPI000BF6F086|nr:hypothetical protein [Bacillus wiedmannii]PEU23143.1 hypothetical protein CN526_23040 [Bacillus wiedmannii]
MKNNKNNICNLLKEKLKKMSAEEKITRTNQLHADLETIYADMLRIDDLVNTVTMNIVSEAFENLYLEFQLLAIEGFYAEKQYETYKEYSQDIKDIEPYDVGYGFVNRHHENAIERLRTYIEEEDITPKQTSRIHKRMNYKG